MARNAIILIALAAAAAACGGSHATPETPETAARALDSSAQNLSSVPGITPIDSIGYRDLH